VGVIAWTPSDDEVLDLDGVHRRADRFRFELCDRDLRPIGDLHPDRTGSPLTIENDTANNTSRRLRGFRLLPDEAADVNVITDRLRVYMVLQNGTEYRLGTFLWADANLPLRSWGSQQDADLVDFTYILDQQATQAFGWGRGASLALIVLFLLGRAGFELNDIDSVGDEARRSLTAPMSWQPGTTWLEMLNDLGRLVGFASPWFDRDGRLHFDQPPNPELDELTVSAYGPGGRVIADSIVYSNDLLQAPNDFAVFDSATDQIRAGRYQLPASAPHSFANRGFRIGLTESVQGLSSQALADKAAANLARTHSVAYEWLTFSSTADPRHETWDVIDAFDQRWLETSWSMELRSGGPMIHTLRRTAYAL
jgi:hypothetical protein